MLSRNKTPSVDFLIRDRRIANNKFKKNNFKGTDTSCSYWMRSYLYRGLRSISIFLNKLMFWLTHNLYNFYGLYRLEERKYHRNKKSERRKRISMAYVLHLIPVRLTYDLND